MAKILLDEIEESSRFIDAQICVIGAGIGGLLFARRLAQGGRKVVVVESGIEGFDDEIHRLNEIEDPATRYTRALTGRYRGLGGSSTRWGGRMIPISAHESSARPYISQSRWPLQLGELEAYHHEIESLFGTGHDSYEHISGDRPDVAMFPAFDTTLTPRWAKCPTFKQCNIATVLADDLRNLPGVEIWLGATVCDFELDRAAGCLSAITARSLGGKTLTVRANDFVIAAGTIETTRLLLLLDRISEGHAFRRCRVLGRYFQDHLKAEVATIGRGDPSATNRLFGYRFVNSVRRDLHLELSKSAQHDDAVASAFAYVAMDIAESPLADIKRLAQGLQRGRVDPGDIWRLSRNLCLVSRAAWWRIMRNQLYIPASVDLRLLVCVEQLPHRANRISLAEKRDRFGMPKALFEWGPTETEEQTFQSCVARIGAYWTQAGFDRICPLTWLVARGEGAAQIIDRAEACAHPSGSTRMGTVVEDSVVDPDLWCHEVPNVAALSASVFPTAGSANPTFTIMKLALWLGDSYLRRLSSQVAGVVAKRPSMRTVPI